MAWSEAVRSKVEYASRVRGCLLGGAIGDALGAPVEFQTLERILADAPDGGWVRDYRRYDDGSAWGSGLVTDDTQLTLFTAEGLIRAQVRFDDRGICHGAGVLHHAYARWYATQTNPAPGRLGDRESMEGWLVTKRWLYSRRAPGTTCLAALAGIGPGSGYGAPARNDSKGCGAVMRSAPIGLYPGGSRDRWSYDLAVEAAALTHGHRTGQVAAGALAHLIALLADGLPLERAVAATVELLDEVDRDGETVRALRRAVDLVGDGEPVPVRLERLGGGWVAEEALAIAVHAALSFPRFDQVRDALAFSVTHSGDSDSTGSICGNLLGTLHGDLALPADLAFCVEGRGTILELADDFVYEFGLARQKRLEPAGASAGEVGGLQRSQDPIPAWYARYPGW